MPTMKMGPVINPANNDKMQVQANVPKPPPVTSVTNPRDVGEDGALFDKDLILAAQGASGSILNVSNGNAVAASFSEGPPDGHVIVDANLDEVTVDDYYDPATGLTDTTLSFITDGEIVTIRG